MTAQVGQSVDELIMCLVGMGFEVEDCQQAVQMGKLSVEEAVEWLLQGKPIPTAPDAPRLRLGLDRAEPTMSANPFVTPNPPVVPDSAQSSVTSPSESEAQAEEDQIVSRLHLKDDQRVVKERFEEKQREEAKRLAREEKMAHKRAHASVMKQIAEDREKQKMLRAAKGTPGEEAPSGVSPQKQSPPPAQKVTTSEKAPPTKAIIQIRLPTGKTLRQEFSPESKLSEVKQVVLAKHPGLNNWILMQPFPRVEYSDGDMEKTLTDLGLTPTGSLVVKKLETATTSKPEPMDQESFGGSTPGPVDHPPPSGPGHPAMPMPPIPPGSQPDHQWGAGHSLGSEGETGQAVGPDPTEGMEPDLEVDSDSEGEDQFGAGGQNPVYGQAQHNPILGGALGGGMGFPGAHHHQQGQSFWGVGQRLADDYRRGEELAHHHMSPAELAAQAARQRFAEPRAAEAGDADQIAEPSVTSHQVSRLTDLIIQQVSGRICDTQNPITTLQGLPAEIALKVLDHLVKEGLLRPKTLHPFVSCRLRRLVLDCYKYTTNELLTALRLHTGLVHLSLHSCPLITDKGLQALTALKKLKFLNIGSCRQVSNSCVHTLTALPSLVTLVVEDTSINDEGVAQLASNHPEQLQHLNLNRTPVTSNCIQALNDIQNLRSLSLEHTQVSSLAGIHNLTKLETLNVCGTLIVTDSLLCLSNLPCLRALNIANTPNVHGDLALQYISALPLTSLQLASRHTTTDKGLQSIKEMPLRTLDLTSYINITDAGIEHLSQMTSLHKLQLSNCKIGDAGIVFLQGLVNLEELYLDRTSVTDVGAAVVQAFTKLTELSLSETCIGDEFLKAGHLNRCVLLSKLSLSRTPVTSKGVVHLCLPSLTLLNLDGTRTSPDVNFLIKGCPSLNCVLLNNLLAPPRLDEEDME